MTIEIPDIALKAECPQCKGAGKTPYIPVYRPLRPDEVPGMTVCHECRGTGLVLTPLGRQIVELVKDTFDVRTWEDSGDRP